MTPLLLTVQQITDAWVALTVKAILDHRGDPNLAHPTTGQTAAMFALERYDRDAESLEYLLSFLRAAGADLNARDKNGRRALDYIEARVTDAQNDVIYNDLIKWRAKRGSAK